MSDSPEPPVGVYLALLLVGVVGCAALGVAVGFGIHTLRGQGTSAPAKSSPALVAGTPFVVGTAQIVVIGAPTTVSGNRPPSAPTGAASPRAAATIAPPGRSIVTVPGKPNFYLPVVSTAALSPLEQTLFVEINSERSGAGLPALTVDPGLTIVARTRSQQMADQNYFAETDPFGYSMNRELLAYYGFTGYLWAGENISMNNEAEGITVESAMTSIMADSIHRANILATDYARVGVGEVTTADGRHIFTMIFLG